MLSHETRGFNVPAPGKVALVQTLSPLALVLTCILASATAQADITVGGDRPVRIHVPATYDPSLPAPLILSLHGYGGDGAGMESFYQFNALSDREGFLFAAPDGVLGPCGSRFWNATDVCCMAHCGASGVDDSGYLRRLIDETRAVLNVDLQRVYVHGYSAGGFMAYRLACDHADLIAGIAIEAGATFKDTTLCAPASQVNVLHIHGTLDINVPYGGGVTALGGPPAPGALESVEDWATYNGCELTPEDREPFDFFAGLPGKETQVTRYGQRCTPGGEVELWTVTGADHALANPHRTDNIPVYMAEAVRWLLSRPKNLSFEASFSMAPGSGPAPLEVTVDASASTAPEGTTIILYRWDFDDGTTMESAAPIARHKYTEPGRYTISLRVGTADGRWSLSARGAAVASCPPGDIPQSPLKNVWTQAHVGEPAFPGSASLDAGSGDLLLCAGGAGLVGTTDEWLLVHRAADGDFRLTARVSDLAGGGTNARVGLAFRESLAPNARFAGVFLIRSAAGDRLIFGHREEQRSSFRSGAAVHSGATWLRIERRGDLFRGSASADGEEWTLVREQEIAGMPGDLLLGIAATGSDTTPAAGFAAFRSRVSAPALESLGPAFRRGDANDDGKVDIADGLRILNHLFLGALAPACADAADANDSGGDHLDLSDAIAIFEFLFVGTRPSLPPPGHGACGADPTEDTLGCGGSEGCPG